MAEDSLGGLLRREESTADLLAFLFGQDPEPLIQRLGLPTGRYRARRERLAVLISDAEQRPAAVLQIGEPNPSRLTGVPHFLVTLDHLPAPSPWRAVGLDDVFGAWVGRPGTGWLAGHVLDVLRLWQEQADGPVGRISGTHGVDVLVRRLAADLGETSHYNGATRQLMARQRPEGYSGAAWAAVELRCPRSNEWVLRPSVDASDREPTNDVLTEVYDVAMGMRQAMSYEGVMGYLREQGHDDLARYLRAGKYGGFRGGTDDEAVGRWHRLALAGNRRRSHPFFFQGGGRRLSTQFSLAVEELDRRQLRTLISATLHHLTAAMNPGGSKRGR